MNIKDYLHYYYWQLCQFVPNHLQGTTKKYYGYIKELPSSGTEVKIEITESEDGELEDAPTVWAFMSDVKPLLRRLSDMTEQEGIPIFGNDMYWDVVCQEGDYKRFTVNQFHYLLKQGFDLWGLIDAGAAIDSNTIKEEK